MFRYKLTIEYNGSKFHGWQKQKNMISVQETIEQALEVLLKEHIIVHCAGRTDAGVHAIGQVAHFDTSKSYSSFAIQECVNNNVHGLPVAITKIELVSNTFHSRRDAAKRYYIYKIINRYPALTLQRGLFLHVRCDLDIDLMCQAAKYLIGTHDFSAFRASGCQSLTPVKTIYDVNIIKQDEVIEMHFLGNAFLYHQVRNMVGTLLLVGKKRLTVEEFIEIIGLKDRTKSGPTVAPDGLYLFQIKY